MTAHAGRLVRVERAAAARAAQCRSDYARFTTDPVGYADKILDARPEGDRPFPFWWEKQQEIARALMRPPYRVLVKAGHSVGKSHLAGGLINHWFDTHNPGVCLTTAPTARQVRDVLWKEVRRQRRGRGGFPGPKIPRLESSPVHFAHGLTARDATSFQGQHEAAVLVIFDEAVGVDREFWEAAESMVMGQHYAWLAIFNPTDPSSQAYAEELSERWTVIDIPVTDHPNIRAELEGRPPPYPSAVSLGWLEDHVKEWCDPIRAEDAKATDLEWRGRWYRPGPLAEARILARWPTAAAGVWSDSLWSAAEQATLPIPVDQLPQIGCDVARFGSDLTAVHVRCGPVSLHHESANGWDTSQTAGRLKQLCAEYAEWATRRRAAGTAPVLPQHIPIAVDDDGVGGGVVDQLAGWAVVPVNAQSRCDERDYPNRRSQLWFEVADRARKGRLSLGRLPADVRRKLRAQVMAPTYRLTAAGQREVERKEVTKDKLGRSPDDADALNLAFHEAPAATVGRFIQQPPPPQRGYRQPLRGR